MLDYQILYGLHSMAHRKNFILKFLELPMSYINPNHLLASKHKTKVTELKS